MKLVNYLQTIIAKPKGSLHKNVKIIHSSKIVSIYNNILRQKFTIANKRLMQIK